MGVIVSGRIYVFHSIGLLPPHVTRTGLLPRLASFSFNAAEFSLPVKHFILTLNRVTGDGQRFCGDYEDVRHFVRVYEKELPDIFPPQYTPRDDSKVFMQDFFNLEEISSYRATFTAEFNTLGTQANRTTHINFDTPGDGKIQYYVPHILLSQS